MSKQNGQAASVPHGYKMTEVGVVPEEWGVANLGDLASVRSGGTPSTAQGEFWNGPLPWCTPTDITRLQGKRHIRRTERTISESGLAASSAELIPTGSVVMTTRATIGACAINVVPMTTNQGFKNLIPGPDIDGEFLFYQMSAQEKGLVALCGGSTFLEISKAQVSRYRIPYPVSLPEQNAIATALSDTDDLITSLERLITKKRRIKQGTMQELLSGERRLEGFEGEWERRRLGEVAHVKTGSKNTEDRVHDGHYPFFGRSEVVERINSYSHDCEAILVPGEGRIGEIFHYICGKFDVHQRVYAITEFDESVDGRFVHYFMKSNFGHHAMELTVKATVDSLRLPTFLDFEMTLPNSRAEQKAIAHILTTLDTELTTLETKLMKLRRLKEGMMGELLGGRVRLV